MACRAEVTGRRPRVSADRVKQPSGPPQFNEITATSHAEPHKARPATTPPIRGPPIPAQAFLVSGYRFKDLQASGIVSSRSDLHRKQRALGFPRPIKTGERSAWWPASEVHAWLRSRAALRGKREADTAA
jgi:predicted DNA-binding transcriptional regulator AlpA